MRTIVHIDRIVIEASWEGSSEALRSAVAQALRSRLADVNGPLDRDRAAALVPPAVSAVLETGRRP